MPRRMRTFRCAGALGLAALLAGAGRAQEPAAPVGYLEGDDVAVKGYVSLVREGGRRNTALASGSEVSVRSGSARLVLDDGSEVDICGPAHFSVLKSGEAVTLALNTGRLHARLSPSLPLVLYTPLVVATPLSIAERPRDVALGVEAGGAVCARTLHGAMRLEQQLTSRRIVLPEGGEVVLPDGEIGSLAEAPGGCRCDAILAEDLPPAQTTPTAHVSGLPEPAGPPKEEPPPQEPPPAPPEGTPTWQVVMPPLTFDAANPELGPEPSLETVVLIRTARVQTTVVLSGRVGAYDPDAASPEPPSRANPSGVRKAGFGTRLKNFFRRMFGRSPRN